jgi:hypothetical protein
MASCFVYRVYVLLIIVPQLSIGADTNEIYGVHLVYWHDSLRCRIILCLLLSAIFLFTTLYFPLSNHVFLLNWVQFAYILPPRLLSYRTKIVIAIHIVPPPRWEWNHATTSSKDSKREDE